MKRKKMLVPRGFLSIIIIALVFEVAFAERKPYKIAAPVHRDIGIEGFERKITQSFIERYMSDAGREWIAASLFRSVPYRPYIQKRLRSCGMPMFLQYLPIIEASYKPTAVSPSGAMGIWQFMENSMHPFLKKSEFYDERLDPWLETDAALSKLSDNYKMFGDWALALAAYNMGAGALLRLRREFPGQDYWWYLEHNFLPRQTAEYVPKLIAVADIVENAAYYGAIEIGGADKWISGMKYERFSYIKIKGSASLVKISELTEIPLETLKFLNPSLLQDATPPDEIYRLRLPPGMNREAAAKLTSKRR